MTDRGMSSLVDALYLADEIEQNWADPKVRERGYQWEHLGDAERDIRRLIDGLRASREAIRTYVAFRETQGLGHKMHRVEVRGGGIYKWECDPDCPVCVLEVIARGE